MADHSHGQYYDLSKLETWLAGKSTSDLSEGTNLYFTEARAAALVGDTVSSTWMGLASGFKTEPTFNTTIGLGDVWNYVYSSSGGDVTYYRLVPSGAADDAFYEDFDGSNLTNLVATKAITL